MTDYKPKKGDVIAIERVHSNHAIGMKRTEYRDWTLGRALRVTRKGIVEAFVLGDKGVPYTIDRNVRIATISDKNKREAAERLLKEQGAKPFDNADDLKAAILAA
jgi:hypothetical protein